MKLFRTIILVILAAILVAGPGRPAEAHRNDESYLYLDVGDATLSGR